MPYADKEKDKAYHKMYHIKWYAKNKERLSRESKEAYLVYKKEHPLHARWQHMMKRCGYQKTRDFDSLRRYAFRGIDVCERWRVFENYEKDIIALGWRTPLQVDRIDNNKGYSPDNVRFVTPKENVRNREVTFFVTYHGVNQPLAEVYEKSESKIPYYRVLNRVKNLKWNVEDALYKPLRKDKRRKVKETNGTI